MELTKKFSQDTQGRRYADVLKHELFQSILVFFADPDRQRRMVESELHHDRPALAGVVRELECLDYLNEFFATNPGHMTTRIRQAVGVLVRIIMESKGWKRTGRKGSLGVRAKPSQEPLKKGAATNTGGLSVWFTRAERFEPPSDLKLSSAKERSEQVLIKYVLSDLEIE